MRGEGSQPLGPMRVAIRLWLEMLMTQLGDFGEEPDLFPMSVSK